MRIAILFGPMCLAFRGSFDFTNLRDDPRGMTGSEIGFARIAECLRDQGHEITLHTVAEQTEYAGMQVRKPDAPIEAELVIATNEPDLLRAAPAGAFRVCPYWLNDTSFCRVGFEEHVDLFLSPSAPHLRQVMTNKSWREVERTNEHPHGRAVFTPDPAKWVALPLGCDPERYVNSWEFDKSTEITYSYVKGTDTPLHKSIDASPTQNKIHHRVIYCSSPDRGLHHLLAEWPAIRRAVPDATLHVFYRIEPWLRGFDQTPWFPPIEPLRARANYVEECLTRFREAGGMGVTLRDSVSRATIEREMAQAEVLAYPCDTTTWSEGFSCTVLEACAARACPIITACDALGEVYAPLNPVPRSPGWVSVWRDRVIAALLDPKVREEQNAKAYELASKLTWKRYAERLMEEIEARR